MVARFTCRETILFLVAALCVLCVTSVTAPTAIRAQGVGPSAKDADAAISTTKKLTDPTHRCEPSDDGAIVVCGSDTDRHRLSPELRAIAGIGTSTKDSIPRAPPASAAVLGAPSNWQSLGGHYKPGPAYDPLYEMVKRATDPETGVPPPPSPEP